LDRQPLIFRGLREQALQLLQCVEWFGAPRIIGVQTRVSHDAVRIDDEARRYRKRPTVVAVDRREVDAEIAIQLLQVVRKSPPQPIGKRDFVRRVMQDLELQLLLLDQDAAVLSEFG